MAFVTVQDAIREVALGVSLINGSGMTPYSDDMITSLLQQAHQFINKEQVWSDSILTYNRVLDGTTGRITVGIPSTEVSDAKKVFRAYHESSMQPAAKLSGYVNTDIATSIYGYTLISKVQDPGPQKLLLQWYPATLTGSVIYLAKAQYDFTDYDMEIPIDFWLHVYRALWQYAVSDGTNPAQMEAYQDNYNKTLALVKGEENARPLQMDPYSITPDIWIESDDSYWSGR
jgi:hypothetical protein